MIGHGTLKKIAELLASLIFGYGHDGDDPTRMLFG